MNSYPRATGAVAYTRGFRYRTAIAALATLLLITACGYFVSPQTRVERAEAQIAKGNYRGALIELKNALQSQPDSAKARLLLAEVALWLGDASSAETELGRVPSGTDPVRQADLRARIDLALGRSQPLLDRLATDGTQIEPARLALYRGQALQGLNRAVEAEQQFRAATKADPGLLTAQVGIVNALLAQKKIDEASKATDALVAAHPDSALARYSLGVLFTHKRDNAQAIAAFKRAHELAPTQVDVLRQVALLSALTEAQLAGGKIDDAKVSSEMLQKLVPGSPLAMLMSSRVLMASHDYASASTQLRQLVNAMPGFPQGRFLLGVALVAQGNLEQAAQELNQVVAQAPENLEARQLLAQVRMRLDDPEGALRVLVPALESDNQVTSVTALVDAARTQAGASARTIELLEQQLAKSPGNAGLVVQLASAYLQADDPGKALTLLRQSTATEADPRREALLLQALLKVAGEASARQQAETLLAAHSTNPQIVSLVAAFFARVGDIEAGRRSLTNALARNRDSTELLFALAQLEWAARRPTEARKSLQSLLQVDEAHAAARLALAELELASGNKAAARTELERMRSRDKSAVAPRMLLARLALADNAASQADGLIAEVLAGAKNEIDIRAAAGNMYLEHGRYDQAIEHFQAGVEIDASAAPLWFGLGRAQLALNQSVAARESFEQAHQARPKWIAPEGALAFLDLQLGDRESALRRVADLRKERPRDATVLALQGQILSSLRQYREAVEAFDAAAAIEMSASNTMSSYQARTAGDLPDPTQPLERWLGKHPGDLRFRSVLADAYTRTGQRQKAIEQYEFIVSRQPQQPAALNNLAWLYYEQKDGRAVEMARRASAAAPDSAAVSDTLGWILVETGRLEEGLGILGQASARADASPEIAYHHAVALVRSGSIAEGRRRIERLLKDHPTFPSRSAAERQLERFTTGAALDGL